jgi:hypothetical protein
MANAAHKCTPLFFGAVRTLMTVTLRHRADSFGPMSGWDDAVRSCQNMQIKDKEQFMRKERPDISGNLEAPQELIAKHGTRIMRGYCHDCSQGSLSLARDGFEYWNEEGDGRGFWFCRYCGSNHVTVTTDDGVVVEQGDI